MLNEGNIDLFDKEEEADGYEYIVGDRLKSLSEEATDYLTDLKNYTTIKIEKVAGQQQTDNDEAIFLRYCTYAYNGRTIICTWSQKRAAKDKATREEKLKKAQQMLKKPALIERKSKKYFIKSTDKKKYELDHKQIEWQAKFDGFKAIATNMADVKPEIALEKYKDLYKIEQSFRTFKSYLETRPMFHWTDKRIEGHLVLCYIAFCLLNYLQQKSNYSEQTIRTALNKMDLSKIAREKEISWLRSAVLSLTPFRDNKLIINTSRS